MGHVSEWFVRVTQLPHFLSAFGAIKPTSKSMKPGSKLLVKEKLKPVVEEKKPSAKNEDNDDDEPKEEKKLPNPLDLLPPSSFDLFNFKTLFVNHKDKSGGGIDELKKIFDPAGYAIWFLHYEKYKGEGEVLFKTENLSKGFLQRFDTFRKHAFARHCVLGEEPNLEI